jgi:hypothetical protein
VHAPPDASGAARATPGAHAARGRPWGWVTCGGLPRRHLAKLPAWRARRVGDEGLVWVVVRVRRRRFVRSHLGNPSSLSARRPTNSPSSLDGVLHCEGSPSTHESFKDKIIFCTAKKLLFYLYCGGLSAQFSFAVSTCPRENAVRSPGPRENADKFPGERRPVASLS